LLVSLLLLLLLLVQLRHEALLLLVPGPSCGLSLLGDIGISPTGSALPGMRNCQLVELVRGHRLQFGVSQ
jgi:hypothetical protein